MEVSLLPTRAAARRVGVNVQKFHRLAALYDVKPRLSGDGLTGAKFWHPDDVALITLRFSIYPRGGGSLSAVTDPDAGPPPSVAGLVPSGTSGPPAPTSRTVDR
jgi:hypothetical protein